jgi:hypothetical protein
MSERRAERWRTVDEPSEDKAGADDVHSKEDLVVAHAKGANAEDADAGEPDEHLRRREIG